MHAKVLSSYSKLPVGRLATKCKEVLEKMTGNANFPNPRPTMADYKVLVTAFDKVLVEAATGAKLAIAQRKTLEKELLAKTKSLAQYVNAIAEGDPDALVSSGLTVARPPQSRILGNPANLRILQGTNPGSLVCKVNCLKGAISYTHQYTPHPLTADSVWTSAASSRCKYEFEGLKEGKMYWFKVTAIGSRDQITYSNEIAQFVSQRTFTIVE